MTTSAQSAASLANLDSLLSEIKGLLPTDEQLLGLYSFLQGLPADLHRQAAREVLLGACKSLCPRLAGTAAMFLGEGESEELMLEPDLLSAMRDSLYLASVTKDEADDLQPDFIRMVRRGAEVHGAPFDRDCLEAMLRLIHSRAGLKISHGDWVERIPSLLNVFQLTVTRDQYRDELAGDAVLFQVIADESERFLPAQRQVLQYVYDNLSFNRDRCRDHLHELRKIEGLTDIASRLQPQPDDGYAGIIAQGMLPGDEQKLLKYLREDPEAVLTRLLKTCSDDFAKVVTETLLQTIFLGEWMTYVQGIDWPEYKSVRFLLDKFCERIAKDAFMAGRLARIKSLMDVDRVMKKLPVSYFLAHAALTKAGFSIPLPKLDHLSTLVALSEVMSLEDPHEMFSDCRAGHMDSLRAAMLNDCLEGYQVMAPHFSWPRRDAVSDDELRQRVLVTRWLQEHARYNFDVPDDLRDVMNTPGTRFIDYPAPRELIAKEAPQSLILEVCRFDPRLMAPAIDLKLLDETYVAEATDEGATLLMSQTLEV